VAVLDLALLGTGGMQPLPERWLASTLIRSGSQHILFDCGEGTQITLRRLGWGITDVDAILISHLHGDHVGGLPGLLLSQGNGGRTEPVDVYGPPGLSRTVQALRVIAPYLPFEVRCHNLEGGEQWPVGNLTASCTAADHSVPCLAYRLDLARRPLFLPQQAERLGVPRQLWSVLAHGDAVTWEGRTVNPEDVLGPPRPGLAVGLVTDTRPTPAIRDLVQGVTALVCEGTYGSDEEAPRAEERKHMTFREAATLARQAQVSRLILTHFSPSLTDPAAYAELARSVFPDTVVGYDHLTVTLKFPDP
jgi:ribonuclease Z